MEATKAAKIPKAQRKANEFLTILKKDIREVIRTKRFFLYSMIAFSMMAFAWVTLGVLQIIIKFLPEGNMQMRISAFGALTMSNAMGIFTMFLTMYFVVAIVIFIRNIVSKEIAENKWTLPLQAGVKPWKLVLSKIVVYTVAILIAGMIAMFVHLILALAITKPETRTYVPHDRLPPELIAGLGIPDGVGYIFIKKIGYASAVGNMFANFGHIIVSLAFISVCVLAINAITKKSWPAIIVPLSIVTVVSMVFNQIAIGSGGLTLIHYSPLLFFESAGADMDMMSGQLKQAPGVLQYMIASAVTIGIMVGLIFWAVRKSKVRGLADKRAEE